MWPLTMATMVFIEKLKFNSILALVRSTVWRLSVGKVEFRCLHTLSYVNSMQPMRSLCHGVGVTASLLSLTNAVNAVL